MRLRTRCVHDCVKPQDAVLCLRLRKGVTHRIATWSDRILRIRRPYACAYAGMETPLDHLMGTIFFTHTHIHMDKRRHSLLFHDIKAEVLFLFSTFLARTPAVKFAPAPTESANSDAIGYVALSIISIAYLAIAFSDMPLLYWHLSGNPGWNNVPKQLQPQGRHAHFNRRRHNLKKRSNRLR